MAKVIFFDVDGTLVTRSGKLSKRVKHAILDTRKKGNYAFLCTGRNIKGVSDLYQYFDGAICSAGGYVQFRDDCIYEEHLNEEDIKEARNIFEENGVFYNLEASDRTFQCEGIDRLFVAGNIDPKHINSEMERLIMEHNKRFNSFPLEEYDRNPKPIHKMCFIAVHEKDLMIPKQKLSYKYNFIVHEMFSDTVINGEIIKKSMNKATGIQHVLNKLNLSFDDTICFGDSMNDFEMIQACHHSVVMANGSEELKKHATCICEDVENDGVYHELVRLNLCDK